MSPNKIPPPPRPIYPLVPDIEHAIRPSRKFILTVIAFVVMALLILFLFLNSTESLPNNPENTAASCTCNPNYSPAVNDKEFTLQKCLNASAINDTCYRTIKTFAINITRIRVETTNGTS